MRTFVIFLSLLVILPLSPLELSRADEKGSDKRGTSVIARLNREKEDLMHKAQRFTLQVFNELADPFNGGGPISKSHGSGFIVDIQGDDIILFTNKHVIEIPSFMGVPTDEGMKLDRTPDFIFRKLNVGKKFGNHKVLQKADAEVLFVSPIYDFAVLKVKIDDLGEGAREYFQTAELAKNSELMQKILRQGRQVMTFGYPQDASEVGTQGTISATSQNVEGMKSVILTDAPINGGNSGGPLIDMETGIVLGVNTWKNQDADNMGFAQPILNVWEEYERFLQNPQYGSRKIPFIYVIPEEKNFLMQTGLMDELEELIPGFSKNFEEVLMVQHVEKGIPLLAGDILLEINGQTIEGSMESMRKLYNLSEGKKIEFTIYRAGKLLKVKVPMRNVEVQTEAYGNYLAVSGMVFRDITNEEKEIHGLNSGIVIGSTYHDPMSGSSADLEGSIVSGISGPAGVKEIKNIKDLKEYLMQSPLGSFLHYRVFIGSSSTFVGNVRTIIRPSRMFAEPYAGFVDSEMVPLKEFRKNYDFTGLDVPRSNLGAQIVNACQQALSQLEEESAVEGSDKD